MGFTSARGVLTLLVLTASMLAVGLASRSIAGRPANYWNFGFNHSFWGPRNGHPFHPNNNNTTRPPKKFIVGGSEHWRYGFNYTDWALNNGPFYVNDTLGQFITCIYQEYLHSRYLIFLLFARQNCKTMKWYGDCCSVQVWSSKQDNISSQCVLAAKPLELLDMRPQQGGAGGYGGSRRRWGFRVCAEELVASLLCLRRTRWVALQRGDDEVLCDAAAWSLPWLINGELAREEEDAVLQCFRLLLIWKQ